MRKKIRLTIFTIVIIALAFPRFWHWLVCSIVPLLLRYFQASYCDTTDSRLYPCFAISLMEFSMSLSLRYFFFFPRLTVLSSRFLFCGIINWIQMEARSSMPIGGEVDWVRCFSPVITITVRNVAVDTICYEMSTIETWKQKYSYFAWNANLCNFLCSLAMRNFSENIFCSALA